MSVGDSVDKPLSQSISLSIRKVYLKIIRVILLNKLRLQVFGKASTVYSKLALAAIAQLISALTFTSELGVNTPFCRGTPNPKNSEYRLTNTLQRRREEDK